MSLSAWEQQALDCIEDELAGSDTKLASLLATFARHASGQELPAREKIPNPALRRGNVRRLRADCSRAWACSRPCCCCGSLSPSR